MSEDLSRLVLGRRVVRGTMYLLIALAGFTSFFLHLPFLDDVINTSVYVIGFFMLVGGLVSGVGHVLRILVVERAGYPLMVTALTGITIVLFIGADEQSVRLFFGLLTLAFTLGMYGRGRDLLTLLRIQREEQEGERDGSRH